MTVLVGTLATGSAAFAAVDPDAHHVEGKLGERRFTAFPAPYTCEADARNALAAAGAINITDVRRKAVGA